MNPCQSHPDCVQFPLNNGGTTHVSIEDSSLVAGMKSLTRVDRRSGRMYVQFRSHDGKSGYIHRALMGFPLGLVDHIHHNGLDNRRTELRVLSNSQNLLNRKGPNPRSKSGKVGVVQMKSGRWRAQITVSMKMVTIGRFDTTEEASAAHDAYRDAAIARGAA